MGAYFTVIRPLNSIMAAIAVWIGSLLAGAPYLPTREIALGMVATFLICGGGMVVNDYVDREIDKINRPKRPIASGQIKKAPAIIYAAILFAVGLGSAFLAGPAALAVAAVAAALLVAYAAKLKRVTLVGHVAISFLVALTFLYGGFILGNIGPIIPLAILAFLSNLGREIYKTIDDIMGDKQKNVKTLATRYGVVKAKHVAAMLTIIAVAYSFFPYIQGQFNQAYLFLVIIADILFVLSAVLNVKHSSKLTKVAMVIALLAFIAGALSARGLFSFSVTVPGA